MMRNRAAVVFGAVLLFCGGAVPAAVLVTDSGVQGGQTIGPGAPAHVVGLQSYWQQITLDTGKRAYAVRYSVARDPKNPQVAVPGEGYIGMPQPAACNWYASGFFDVLLNGKSIGGTLIHSLTGRSADGRGTADFVFDAVAAVVRVRFVALAGGDCLYTQVRVEPKQEITEVAVLTRCYPSGFITNSGARHVLTAVRDLAEGERASLDVANEWWTLYYDRLFDAGYMSPSGLDGVGPCAMLWLPEQTAKVDFAVDSYGIQTACALKPAQRDFRFIFFDFAGIKNEAAQKDLRGRAAALRQELSEFAFTDAGLAQWPLAQKQAEVQKALALLPDDKEAAARYERWGQELATQLQVLQAGADGAIMAEANVARIVGEWERGLPDLLLKALLNKL
jgi:hypothetical protein